MNKVEIKNDEDLQKAIARLDKIWSVRAGDHDWEERCELVERFTVLEADEDYPIGWKMAIRYLTDNARERAEENHPNLATDCKTEDLCNFEGM